MLRVHSRYLVLLLALLPIGALAQITLARTTSAVNVRAGPDAAFPVVTWVPARTQVSAVGCTYGGQWCDVVIGRRRGWVHSRYLSPILPSRMPVLTFSVAEYWEAHYQGRPWYSERARWEHWKAPSPAASSRSAQ
jgi:uncharacterized protein YraI